MNAVALFDDKWCRCINVKWHPQTKDKPSGLWTTYEYINLFIKRNYDGNVRDFKNVDEYINSVVCAECDIEVYPGNWEDEEWKTKDPVKIIKYDDIAVILHRL